MSIVKNSTAVDVSDVQFVPQNQNPSGATEGDLYYDDGTNTITNTGALMIKDDTGVYQQIPVYGKGSWAVSIGDGSNNFTTSLAKGDYVRIGNLCHIDIRLTITSLGSASGNVLITLPFQAQLDANRRSGIPVIYTNDVNVGTGYSMSGRTTGSQNLNIVASVSNAVGFNLVVGDFDATSEIELNGTYEVA